MKPNLTTDNNGKQFPLVDCNYTSIALDGFSGNCAELSPSFRSISREYFATEAHHHFLIDGALFVTMLATALVPIVAGAFAVLQLCQAGI